MSEQQHRQWTLYKHPAPALTGRGALARPAPLRSRIGNLRNPRLSGGEWICRSAVGIAGEWMVMIRGSSRIAPRELLPDFGHLRGCSDSPGPRKIANRAHTR
jgi:hypothetical protein